MGKAQEVIKKHIGNPEELLTILDDAIYWRASQWLGGKLIEAYENELTAVQKMTDPKAKQFAVTEAERLKALAGELVAITPPTDSRLVEVIAARYMINPNRNNS